MNSRASSTASLLSLVFSLSAGLGCAASTSASSARHPARASESRTEVEAPAAPEVSTLELWAAEPTDVLIDGEAVGTTPIPKRKVSPGKHDVTFVDPESGNATMTIEIEPGEHQRLTAPPRRAHVREVAPAPAEAPAAPKKAEPKKKTP
jgi:hypothetical protein